MGIEKNYMPIGEPTPIEEELRYLRTAYQMLRTETDKILEALGLILEKLEALAEPGLPKEEPKFGVGDIVRLDKCKENLIGMITAVGVADVYLVKVAGDTEPLQVLGKHLTRLFPTHLVLKELGGYKVGDMVEIQPEGIVGMVLAVYSSAIGVGENYLDILAWMPDRQQFECKGRLPLNVKKLWPAE